MSIEKLKKLRAKREELSKQIRESAKTLFKKASATLFEEHPVLIQFAWTQYTPYFNDGDTCTFSSNAEDAGIWFVGEEKDLDDSPYDHEFATRRWDGKKSVAVPESNNSRAAVAVKEFLGNFDDDDYLGMFGDHTKVVVTKTGVETEEYEHE
jgi:hypothetical protein